MKLRSAGIEADRNLVPVPPDPERFLAPSPFNVHNEARGVPSRPVATFRAHNRCNIILKLTLWARTAAPPPSGFPSDRCRVSSWVR